MVNTAKRTGLGVPLLILGLSGDNVVRLMAGQPVRFNLNEMGMAPMRVIIVEESAIASALTGILPKPEPEPEAGTA